MNKIGFSLMCLLSLSGVTSASATDAYSPGLATGICPKTLNIDDIRKMRDDKKPMIVAGMAYSAVEGLEDIHTRVPIAKDLFVKTNKLKNSTDQDGKLVCEFTYSKVGKREGSFKIEGVPVKK